MKDACDIPDALSCTRLDAPVCLWPCQEKRVKSARASLASAGTIWLRGGALCDPTKDPKVVEGERTCATQGEKIAQPTYEEVVVKEGEEKEEKEEKGGAQ